MKYSFDIEYRRPTVAIDRTVKNISTELKRKTTVIDRIVATWLIEKQESYVVIDKPTYKVIRVNVPIPFDFVYLQNDYLPNKGEYFLN